MTTSIWITIIICITIFATMTVMLICEAIEQKYKYLYERKHEEKTIVLMDTEKHNHIFKISENGYLKECKGDEE